MDGKWPIVRRGLSHIALLASCARRPRRDRRRPRPRLGRCCGGAPARARRRAVATPLTCNGQRDHGLQAGGQAGVVSHALGRAGADRCVRGHCGAGWVAGRRGGGGAARLALSSRQNGRGRHRQQQRGSCWDGRPAWGAQGGRAGPASSPMPGYVAAVPAVASTGHLALADSWLQRGPAHGALCGARGCRRQGGRCREGGLDTHSIPGALGPGGGGGRHCPRSLPPPHRVSLQRSILR